MNRIYDVIIKQINKKEYHMIFQTNKAKNFADKHFQNRLDYNVTNKYITLHNDDHEILNNTLGFLLSNNIKVSSE
ncbi:MAG: hypothetical protein ACOCVF_00940 [bacterium]